MKGIADTGFLVAFANRRDRHHRWAKQLATGVSEPLLTCESVLAETAFHLRDTAIVLAMVDEGLVRLAFRADENLDSLSHLAVRYADRRPDLADLCLIRLSEQHPGHRVVTTDARDFRVYRRNGREVIPLVCPPG